MKRRKVLSINSGVKLTPQLLAVFAAFADQDVTIKANADGSIGFYVDYWSKQVAR